MDDIKQRALRRHVELLENVVDVQGVVFLLKQNDVLGIYEERKIFEQQEDYQLKKLVKILTQKNNQAFNVFLAVLPKTSVAGGDEVTQFCQVVAREGMTILG